MLRPNYVFVLTICLCLMLCSVVSAQQTPVEPPVPLPTPAIQKLLNDAKKQIQSNGLEAALKTVDQALETARQAKDTPGEAKVQRARAIVLEAFHRNEEAIIAWKAAVQSWATADDTPDTVEALGKIAFLLLLSNPSETNTLLEQVMTLAKKEQKRPLMTATQLNNLAKLFYQRRELSIVQDLSELALAIQNEKASGSLDVATSLKILGDVAYSQGNLAEARHYYEQALAIRNEKVPGSLDVAALLMGLGNVAYAQSDLVVAQRYYEQALTIQNAKAPSSLYVAGSLNNLGSVASKQRNLIEARRYYEQALAIKQEKAPGTLYVAITLTGLGDVAFTQSDLVGARRYHEQALAIQNALAPGSLDVANSLHGLGNIAQSKGDFAEAQRYYEQALAIRQKKAPGTLDVANTLNGLGDIAFAQSDLVGAQCYHEQALAIRQEKAPGTLDVAISLGNLGNVAVDLGDLIGARHYFEQALAINQEKAPGSLAVAASLIDMGNIAYNQYDSAGAHRFYEQALEIQKAKAPGSFVLARSLNNLGNVAAGQDNFAGAHRFYEQALEIQKAKAPGSLDVAVILNNLGSVASKQRDLVGSRRYYEQALEIQKTKAPGSLDVAISLNNLGVVAVDQGDLVIARRFLKQSLALKQKKAPGSLNVATSLEILGDIKQMQGQLRPGEILYRQAWEIVKKQSASVTTDETRQAFDSALATFQVSLLNCQIDLHHYEPAFLTLEEGRAQALLQLTLQRRLLGNNIQDTARMDAYQTARHQLDRAIKHLDETSIKRTLIQRQLTALEEPGKANPALQTQLQTELVTATAHVKEAQAATTSLRLEADSKYRQLVDGLHQPQPSSFAIAQKTLPLGTVYLAFSVGDKRTNLFVLQAGKSLQTFTISRSEKQLVKQVSALRTYVTDPGSTHDGYARTLFATLFPPKAQTILRSAKRLLISPDDCLWEAPFAALITNAQGKPSYLGLSKAISYTPSLALFAQAQATPAIARTGKPVALVVGDCRFDSDNLKTPVAQFNVKPNEIASRLPGERGYVWGSGKAPIPLPMSVAEANQIAQLYAAKPLLGPEATEAHVRQLLPQADVIHLATHGYLRQEPGLAMSSGVLLSVPEQTPKDGETDNDGALQAWEIYSQLKLHASLVVLSACETGGGNIITGEGIIGLTRALQVAGCRSVIASQWSVADASTAKLMVALHKRLRSGADKATALTGAMNELAQAKATAHPYYWAPFFLMGKIDNDGLARR